MTHYLRFPDETTGMAELEAAGFLNADGEIITATHSYALDVLGLIYTGGEYDFETNEILVSSTLIPGWHVNLAGDLPDGWADYVVTPAEPIRVFA